MKKNSHSKKNMKKIDLSNESHHVIFSTLVATFKKCHSKPSSKPQLHASVWIQGVDPPFTPWKSNKSTHWNNYRVRSSKIWVGKLYKSSQNWGCYYFNSWLDFQGVKTSHPVLCQQSLFLGSHLVKFARIFGGFLFHEETAVFVATLQRVSSPSTQKISTKVPMFCSCLVLIFQWLS